MPARVTLQVFDPGGNRQLGGNRHTIAIGEHLHIVAVTATPQPRAAPLTADVVYRYDLSFAFDDGLSTNLATATSDALLAYPPFTQPTFCLPPKDLNDLRLIHGSCQKPHGNGKLTDASNVLLGWKEILPVPARYAGLETADKLSAYMRRELLDDCGFTSEDLDAHLLALGEYLACTCSCGPTCCGARRRRHCSRTSSPT